LHILARIYVFLGRLGLIGSGILLFGTLSSQTIPIGGNQTGLFDLSPQFSVFLLTPIFAFSLTDTDDNANTSRIS